MSILIRLFGAAMYFTYFVAVVTAQNALTPLERYRNLDHPPVTEESFDAGWQQRVRLEFEVVNSVPVAELRVALSDKTGFIRAIAARTLGIRGDRKSIETLAKLAISDPDSFVRTRAVEALGLLKAKPGVVAQAKRVNRYNGVDWAATLAEGQLGSDVDFAAQYRNAYAGELGKDEIDRARIGKQAPDFAALTIDGQPFRLSSVLGKKPIAIYFSAHDG